MQTIIPMPGFFEILIILAILAIITVGVYLLVKASRRP